MKVKVRTSVLIDRVQRSKRAAIAANQAAKDAYPAQVEAYRAAVVEGLESALRAAKAGRGLPPHSTKWARRGNRQVSVVEVAVKLAQPVKPSAANVGLHNRRLRELRLTSEPELRIDPYDREWRGVLIGGDE